VELWHVAAALLSALLHASWNAAVKASPRPTEVMTTQMVLGAVACAPALLWTGLPALAAWPWIAASMVMSVVTVSALLRAYTLIGFGAAYPVGRAISVLLVVPLATLLSGERLSLYGFAGVGLIAGSLVLLALDGIGGRAMPRRALGWILLAGCGTASFTICDAEGVRRAGSPWAYGFVTSIANAVAMSLTHFATASPWRIVTRNAARSTPIAIASMVSYLLILLVWSQAPIAPSAALRDTSAIFALLIAIVWLREPFTRLRLFAVVLSAGAVPLLRFA
jgi:drug/metabolite transporter (DMT)-like permease